MADNLPPSLTLSQLQGASKDLASQGAPREVVQGFVDNYHPDGQGNFVLKTSQTNQPITPTPASTPKQDIQPVGDKILEKGIPAIPAPFKQNEGDGTLATVAKTVGNLPTSTINAGTGVLNFLNPVKNISDIASHVKDTYQQIQDYSKQTGENPLSIFGKAMASSTPGQAPDIFKNALKAVTPQFLQDIFKGDFQAATKHITEQPVENIAPLVLVASGIAEKAGVGEEFNKAVSKIASPVTKGIPKVADMVIPEGKTSADKFQEATGKVFQPKNPFETKTAQKVAANIDFSTLPKKTTYSDVSNLLQKNIDEKLAKVDETLGNYKETFKPKDIQKSVTGEGGSTAKVNYVQEGINGLKSLYKTIKDPESLVKIKDLESKFKSEGLTSKEINDLAKKYGTEFGSKAFDKMGNPMTSTGAQTFESIRSGLKENARGVLPDEATKALDKNVSSLIRTKEMTDRMAQKVDLLTNKITQRNLLEKAGRLAGKGVDIVTGGALKAFVTKLFFPSNVGLKTLNSLDLESQLGKNLKAIDKLTNASDAVILKTLKGYAKKANNLPNKIPVISTSSGSQR